MFVKIMIQKEIEIKQHHAELVYGLMTDYLNGIKNRQLIRAIKFIRAEYALGLKEAKDVCE